MTKKKPESEKLKVGRKPKIDDDFSNTTVGKLRIAFLNNATVLQACNEANIHPSTFYDYIKKHPEFNDTISMWKNDTNYKAKCNIRQGIIDGDKELSKWQLSQTDSEYSNKIKQEITNTTPQIVVSSESVKKKIDLLMNDANNN